jgi:PPOX class probable F420-dependent enzyme
MGEDKIQSEPVSQLLLAKNFGYLATLMKDGSPQVTPVWIDLNNGYVIVNAAEERLKHGNVSHDPRVAIWVADHANPYNMVTVRGHVVEADDQRRRQQPY